MVTNLLGINDATFPPKPTFIPKNKCLPYFWRIKSEKEFKFKSVFYDDTKLEPEDSYTSITPQGRSL